MIFGQESYGIQSYIKWQKEQGFKQLEFNLLL